MSTSLDNVLPKGSATDALEMHMFPARCPLLPLGFKDNVVEAQYVKTNFRLIQSRTKYLGICYIIMIWVQLLMCHAEWCWCAETIVGISIRSVLSLLILSSFWIPLKIAEVVSACTYLSLVLAFPLLSNDRLSLVLGGEALELKDWSGQVVHPSDSIFLLMAMCTIICFMLVIPVRSRFSCIITCLVPVVYLSWTLPLPPHGPEPAFITRLVVGILLGIMCILLGVGTVRWEMFLREKFIQSGLKQMEILHDSDYCEQSMLNEGVEPCASQSTEYLPPGCVCLDAEATRHIQSPSSKSALGNTRSVQDAQRCELERLHVQLLACHYVSKLNLAVIVALHDAQMLRQPTENAFETGSLSILSFQYTATATIDLFGYSLDDVQTNLDIAPQQDERIQRTHESTQIETLMLQLLVCRFVGNIGIKAMQQMCIITVAEIQKKHWKNTRAIVQRMTEAQNAKQPQQRHKSNQRKHTLSLPSGDQHMHLPGSQIAGSGSCCAGHACTNCQDHQDRKKDSLDVALQQCLARTVKDKHRPTCSASSTSSTSGNQDEWIPSSHPDLRQFEGTWTCFNADDHVAEWLLALDITGNLVVDATGDVLILKRGMNGHVLLQGGRLVRQGPHLSRIGRRGVVLLYQQA